MCLRELAKLLCEDALSSSSLMASPRANRPAAQHTNGAPHAVVPITATGGGYGEAPAAAVRNAAERVCALLALPPTEDGGFYATEQAMYGDGLEPLL